MTEEEAKTKWCPQAGSSRFERQDERCLGSACMVWRRRFWSAADRTRMITDRQKLKGDTWDQAVSWVNQLEEEAAEGYCGLAGAPQ